MKFKLIALIGLLFLISCTDPKKENDFRCDFTQTFSEPVGSLIIERNGMPFSMASAFLVHKEEGRFTTADHFLKSLKKTPGSDIFLFFQCKKYSVSVENIAGVHDAANVYVNDEYNPDRWPDPYKLSKDSVQVGDTVSVQGVHVHPWRLHYMNIKNDFYDKPVYILRDYYKTYSEDREDRLSGSEFIFDNLKGVVFETGVLKSLPTGNLSERMRDIRNDTNLFFSLRTFRNHFISFGGLSGGPVINQDNEIVGIITLESPQRIVMPTFRVSVQYRELSITPTTEVMEIFSRHQDF